MRKLRCLITALVLALSLSTAVLAGDIQTPTTGYSSPAPAAGETQGPGITDPATSLNAAGDIQAPTGANALDPSIGETLLLNLLLTIF